MESLSKFAIVDYLKIAVIAFVGVLVINKTLEKINLNQFKA
jgi:hypothetical protein